MLQKTYFKTKDYCKVKFVVSFDNADTAEVVGLNNDWQNTVAMTKKKDGSFAAEIQLPKNTEHEFKYLVNENIWLNEPEADKESPNIFGGSNSVIVL